MFFYILKTNILIFYYFLVKIIFSFKTNYKYLKYIKEIYIKKIDYSSNKNMARAKSTIEYDSWENNQPLFPQRRQPAKIKSILFSLDTV